MIETDILNGNIDKDEERQFTYIEARRKLVIDYALTNTETRGKIDKLIIEDRTELDYMSICVYLQLKNEFKATDNSFQYNIQVQQIWTEESIKKFRKKLKNLESKSH